MARGPYAPGGARTTPVDVEHRQRGGAQRGYAGGGYEIELPGAPGNRAQFVVALPSVDKPPHATDFNLFGTLAGANIATTSPPARLTTFNVPPNRVAVIRSISILANSLAVTSDIRWTLLFDDGAVPGWNSLTINPRAAGSVEVSWTPEETYIDVPEGSEIGVDVRVLDGGGPYQLSVSVHGWHYPTALAAVAAAAYPRGA